MNEITRRAAVQQLIAAPVLAAGGTSAVLSLQPAPAVSKRLTLPGSWRRAQITSALAIGNLNDEFWAENISWVSGALKAHSTNILYDPYLSCYYFVFELEHHSTNRSTEVAAVFRYKRGNEQGIFAASFRYPR